MPWSRTNPTRPALLPCLEMGVALVNAPGWREVKVGNLRRGKLEYPWKPSPFVRQSSFRTQLDGSAGNRGTAGGIENLRDRNVGFEGRQSFGWYFAADDRFEVGE